MEANKQRDQNSWTGQKNKEPKPHSAFIQNENTPGQQILRRIQHNSKHGEYINQQMQLKRQRVNGILKEMTENTIDRKRHLYRFHAQTEGYEQQDRKSRTFMQIEETPAQQILSRIRRNRKRVQEINQQMQLRHQRVDRIIQEMTENEIDPKRKLERFHAQMERESLVEGHEDFDWRQPVPDFFL